MVRPILWCFVIALILFIGVPFVGADTAVKPASSETAANGAHIPPVFTTWARVVRKSYTHRQPGGEPVRYLDDWDTWLSIRGSRQVEGQLWYATSQGTWVSANDVRIMPVTKFEGYYFDGTEPGDFGFVLENNTHVHDRPHADANDLAFLSRYTPVGILGMDNGWWRTGEGQWIFPKFIRVIKQIDRPANIGPTEKWIDVNLTQQTVVAYEGDKRVFATMTSTGKGTTPTVTGLFRIYSKVISHTMAGGKEDNDPYTLDEVPWSMYFHQYYAIHGAYWHDQFGTVRSHGCVNLSPPDAKFLFGWAGPTVAPGANWGAATANNPGTWVYVHH